MRILQFPSANHTDDTIPPYHSTFGMLYEDVYKQALDYLERNKADGRWCGKPKDGLPMFDLQIDKEIAIGGL